MNMKHTFLIDENIVYHGIRGVNKHNNPDTSSTLFFSLVALKCHKIVVDKELNKRISKHLDLILSQKNVKPIPYFDLVLNHIYYNSEKFAR